MFKRVLLLSVALSLTACTASDPLTHADDPAIPSKNALLSQAKASPDSQSITEGIRICGLGTYTEDGMVKPLILKKARADGKYSRAEITSLLNYKACFDSYVKEFDLI